MNTFRCIQRNIAIAISAALFIGATFNTDKPKSFFQVSDDLLVQQYQTTDTKLITFLDSIFKQGMSHNNHTNTLYNHGFTPFPEDNIRHVSTVLAHPEFPNILIKTNVKRIRLATEIRQIITTCGLENYIYVPRKTLYHIPGRPDRLSSKNYLLVAEKLHNIILFSDLKDISSVSPFHLAALCLIIKITLWIDCHADNVARTQDGKIAIIDTEDHTYGEAGMSEDDRIKYISEDLRRLHVPIQRRLEVLKYMGYSADEDS